MEVPPEMIFEDPGRFQSRAEFPRDWMDEDLSGVTVFNEDCASFISVWQDPDDEKWYVIDGHRRLQLAKRLHVPLVWVQFLTARDEAEAFARGVVLSLAQWVFDHGDELLWACASRRAAVERALYTGWLNPTSKAARDLYEYYPDLGRRYNADGEESDAED
jgi:hypothetical protein